MVGKKFDFIILEMAKMIKKNVSHVLQVFLQVNLNKTKVLIFQNNPKINIIWEIRVWTDELTTDTQMEFEICWPKMAKTSLKLSTMVGENLKCADIKWLKHHLNCPP